MAVQRPRPASFAVLLVTAALAASVWASAPVRAATAPGPGDVVSVPVTFSVVNTNTTALPCLSDGAPYTVKGHLTAPRATLAAPRPDTVTVYLYGEEGGEWNWHLASMPAYDHATQMANLGHTSLT